MAGSALGPPLLFRGGKSSWFFGVDLSTDVPGRTCVSTSIGRSGSCRSAGFLSDQMPSAGASAASLPLLLSALADVDVWDGMAGKSCSGSLVGGGGRRPALCCLVRELAPRWLTVAVAPELGPNAGKSSLASDSGAAVGIRFGLDPGNAGKLSSESLRWCVSRSTGVAWSGDGASSILYAPRTTLESSLLRSGLFKSAVSSGRIDRASLPKSRVASPKYSSASSSPSRY
mmetsp:Transcript_7751/g.23450  ORF Transcript_7751/g.23450 Transcript_7751/m.23450 type:complete len:229 (-) Transcript_7751:937-1623(-)